MIKQEPGQRWYSPSTLATFANIAAQQKLHGDTIVVLIKN